MGGLGASPHIAGTAGTRGAGMSPRPHAGHPQLPGTAGTNGHLPVSPGERGARCHSPVQGAQAKPPPYLSPWEQAPHHCQGVPGGWHGHHGVPRQLPSASQCDPAAPCWVGRRCQALGWHPAPRSVTSATPRGGTRVTQPVRGQGRGHAGVRDPPPHCPPRHALPPRAHPALAQGHCQQGWGVGGGSRGPQGATQPTLPTAG